MNPLQPGGRQSTAVDAMGQIPGNPLSAIRPGAFPHNTTGVGAAGLGPAQPSPGMRAGPGAALSANIMPNRGTFVSNELVSQPVTTKNWSHTKYERKQRRGDYMFVRRETGDHPTSSAMCSVPQLAEILRVGYQKLISQRSTVPGSAMTLLFFEKAPISEKQSKVADALAKYDQDGEVALTADDELRVKIQNDRVMKLLMFISHEHIREAYNKAGPYMSDGGREVQRHIVLNIGVKGPTHYQEVINYWGNVHIGDSLFLILRRKRLEQASSLSRDAYAEFHWETWAGKETAPPDELVEYKDDAGIVQRGIVYSIGSVVHTPLQWNDEKLIQILLGNAASADEAFEKSAYAKTVEINLGVARHNLDRISI